MTARGVRTMFLRSILLSSLLLASTASAAVNSEMLVSGDWLAQHLKDANLVILHVSANRTAYDAGHVPGARFVSQADLVVTRDGVPNELPPAADLKKLFEGLGVSDTTRIILYGDSSVLPATRAYFTLDYLGHGNHAALLDGGLGKWRADGRAVSQEVPAVAMGRLTTNPKRDLLAELAEVKDLADKAVADKAKAPAALLDVRPPADFRGEQGSHIPGSTNANWTDSQVSRDDQTLRAEQELRAQFTAAGVTAAKPTIVYCNSGMQASQSYFTLKYLGYTPRMYDGSMSEWKAKSMPLEK
jgi:thiosulfate/3-mercaptopyruvate sulfurtransferase